VSLMLFSSCACALSATGANGSSADRPRQSTGPSRSTAESSSHVAPSDPSNKATERTLLNDRAIRRALMRIAHEIVETIEEPERLYLVAIPNGGVPLGRILVENLDSLIDLRVPLGILDTTLYRDDLSTRGSRPRLRRTEMPSSVDGRIVILVEDVVNTGRTIRAGMDALMDFGRPAQVRVVALVDRGHRELPIKIDYVGKNIPTRPNETIVFIASRSSDPSDAPDSSGSTAVTGLLEIVVRSRGELS